MALTSLVNSVSLLLLFIAASGANYGDRFHMNHGRYVQPWQMSHSPWRDHHRNYYYPMRPIQNRMAFNDYYASTMDNYAKKYSYMPQYYSGNYQYSSKRMGTLNPNTFTHQHKQKLRHRSTPTKEIQLLSTRPQSNELTIDFFSNKKTHVKKQRQVQKVLSAEKRYAQKFDRKRRRLSRSLASFDEQDSIHEAGDTIETKRPMPKKIHVVFEYSR